MASLSLCKTKLFILVATAGSFFMAGYLYGGGMQVPEQLPVASNLIVESLKAAHQDVFLKTRDLALLDKKIVEASGWSVGQGLTLSKLRENKQSMQSLRSSSMHVLSEIITGLTNKSCENAQKVLHLIQQATALTFDRLDQVLPSAAGWTQELANWTASNSSEMVVQFKERPFGMHISAGTTYISKVFAGFPAHHLGVHAGCEIIQVAGQHVPAGLLIEALKNKPLPLELKLSCVEFGSKMPGKCVLDDNPVQYRVVVADEVFGMNIQAYKMPRVVEVLPGFPAEACGVQTGFVLTAVNDQRVDVNTWFVAIQQAHKPYTLTFNTQIPLHAGNPFLDEAALAGNETEEEDEDEDEKELNISIPLLYRRGYATFECDVDEMPFGMQMRAPRKGWPVVENVYNGSAADAKGVRKGDVLIRVAGLSVDSSTWFAMFSERTPPFGLTFRRPLASDAATETSIYLGEEEE